MAKRKPEETVDQMVRRIDFPHLRDGGKWLQTNPWSVARLCLYAQRLRDLRMRDDEIKCMFSDLYWDAVTEYKLNKKIVD